MTALREWLRRLWGTFRQDPRDRDLEAELALHLELVEEEMRRRGLSRRQAARAARLEAGATVQAMEALRDQRGLPWLDDLVRDVRHALRSLRRTPGFTIVALLTLALGIGANTAIFSIVSSVILRPLAYPRPDQLMYLMMRSSPEASSEFWVAPAEYFEFRQMNRSFSAVGAYTTGEVNLTAGDRPLRVRSAAVDDQLLTALGIPAEHGRLFAGGEADVSGRWAPGDSVLPSAIAILSHELWQREFGGRPMVGESIEVDGRLTRVIGIMPPGADVMDNRTEIWVPLGLNPATRDFLGYHILFLVGRLKNGVTLQEAEIERDSIMRNWGDRVDLKPEDRVFIPLGRPGGHVMWMRPLQDAVLGAAGRSIWVLQAAVGLVLLIACANLANLLLARTESRHRELAVRTALGASRGRLLRQFVTESLVLSLGGGVLGLWLARVGVEAIVQAFPASLPRTSEVVIDLPVLAFTLAVSMATGVLFGIAPMAHTRLKGLMTALKESGTRGATPARDRVRRALVIAEVALAVILVVGAGLLVRTVRNLTNVDAGFERSRLLTFSITLPDVVYGKAAARAEAYQRLLAALRVLPGVQAATAMSGLPPNRPVSAEDTQIENYVAPPEGPFPNIAYYQSVMSDYFETMGIPLVQGRSFQPADAASSGMVAVVNETLARTFWKGRNPIGQHIRPDWGFPIPWFTVIGVAKDVKQGGVDRKTGTELYFFVDQMAQAPAPVGRAPDTMNVVLRTTLPASTLSRAIEDAVHHTDRAVPVARLRGMTSVFDETIRRPRLLAELLGVFAGLALVLAAIGIYGVLSYMVAARRREIGIRMALGADRSVLVKQVMQQGLRLSTIGAAAGVAGAISVTRLMSSLLFGVQPIDAPTLAAVVITMTLVAGFACWLPARRASRVDPIVVLRED